MMWRDVVDLVTVTHSSDPTVVVSESSRTVFANKKSVHRSEYYPAFANGLRPSIAFEIRVIEYDNQQKLRHTGKDYMILRTYSRNDETVELVCQAFDDVQTNLASLRDTVEVWRNAFVENSMGEQSPQPERLFTLPGQIEFTGGGSTENSGTENVVMSSTIAKVTIRYRAGITSDMFLMIDGKRYEIQRIDDPLNRHETLILTAERTVP